jgi:gliding motility-associated-like protein
LSADTGFNQYTWSPAAQIVGNAGSQTILIRPESDMVYSVVAISETGCVATDSVAIRVKTCGEWLSMPNAFTPNDDGKNDVICPKVTGTLVYYEFSVFNRWGERVFASTSQGKGWDGRVNGNKQGDGVYVWMCEYQFSGGGRQIDRGTFILIR